MSATAEATQITVLTARNLRAARRVPGFVVMNLVQPMIWLLLFGQLFKSVNEIPGFVPGTTYLEFLTPGVVMMMALFGSAWAGTAYIQDMERGVMDRLLTSPVSRTAMIVSTLIYQAMLTVVQTLVVLCVAWVFGARFGGGTGGMLALLAAAVLLTTVFSSVSCVAALLTRNQSVLIGISQLITIPLMFMSAALMDTRLSASWVNEVAAYNPFQWAVLAGREALEATPHWPVILTHLGLLTLLTVVMAWSVTKAFDTYQRSI